MADLKVSSSEGHLSEARFAIRFLQLQLPVGQVTGLYFYHQVLDICIPLCSISQLWRGADSGRGLSEDYQNGFAMAL